MGVVDLAVKMTPSSRFNIETPAPSGYDSETRVAKAGTLLFQILQMPVEERMRILADNAQDEVLILFAMLTPKERRDVIKAAEDFLKQKVTEV